MADYSKGRIIITDLTRFNRQDIVCTAGVTKSGEVIRPMPYLTTEFCEAHNIQPGGILEGIFEIQGARAPHVEDALHDRLVYLGASSAAEFRAALESTLYSDMSEGFGVDVTSGQKCIPISTPPIRSLVTIKVDPTSFSIESDGFVSGKIKAHVTDASGVELSYVGITDRGFFDHAKQYAGVASEIAKINQFIQAQESLYLRLGLSRVYQSPDGRNGFWIQLNGIYTFPDYLRHIRAY